MRLSFPMFSATLAAATFAACAKSPDAVKPEPKPEPVVAAPPEAPKPPPPAYDTVSMADVGLDAAALDRSVKPCDDFYAFACGTWMKNTPIPSDRSRWTRSFSEIDKSNEAELKAILESAATAKDASPAVQKIGAYYAACMDEAAIEKAGTKPIDRLLGLGASVKDKTTIINAILELQKIGISVPFGISGEQDYKDATRVLAYIDQAGLGLPDRDYYVKDDEKSKTIRAAYLAHVAKMLQLSGQAPATAKKNADLVMAFETELAKASKTKVERRDPVSLYNKIDVAGCQKATPSFDWKKYFAALGRPEITDVVVTHVPFLEAFEKQLAKAPKDAWAAYLQWHVIRAAAQVLPKAFVDESFAMSKVLSGQDQIEDRWKRCVSATDDALGELLAQPYLEKRFGPDAKAATEKMVAEISEAFGRNVKELDWMDADTKARADAKRTAIAFHIGYPDKWRSYDFPMDGTYGANALASRASELKRSMDKIGKPVDRDEWLMSPPTVNAYYDPQKNQMVFPAGILQPPFYSVKAGVAVNMGAMGMVVGHELTHGFDDEGSQFDKDGNLKVWWEPKTREAFDAKTKCVADRYETYEAVPGVKLNGKLTLGENIADLGGLKLAFQAYREMRKGARPVVADGFTEDQQYFLSFAQAWCTNAKEEIARTLAQIDPHSPPRWRVNGVVSNSAEFANAFQCAEGSPMRPAEMCRVW